MKAELFYHKVIVHTAVGPRDLLLASALLWVFAESSTPYPGPHRRRYLHWRAEILAAGGYTVLIADMLGDEQGPWDMASSAQFPDAEVAVYVSFTDE